MRYSARRHIPNARLIFLEQIINSISEIAGKYTLQNQLNLVPALDQLERIVESMRAHAILPAMPPESASASTVSTLPATIPVIDSTVSSPTRFTYVGPATTQEPLTSIRSNTFGDPEGLTTLNLESRLRDDRDTRCLSPHYTELNAHVLSGHIVASDVRIGVVRDEVELRGKFYKPAHWDGHSNVVLFLSGSHRPAEAYAPAAVNGYADMGIPVLAVNYRGFGDSTGLPSEQGLYRDSEAMLAYMTASPERGGLGIPRSQIIIHGYSLGSVPAVELAMRYSHRRDKIAGLVLQHPIRSSADVARVRLPGILGRIAGMVMNFSSPLNNAIKAAKLSVPALVVTASADDFQAQGERLFKTMAQAADMHSEIIHHCVIGDHLYAHLMFQKGSSVKTALDHLVLRSH